MGLLEVGAYLICESLQAVVIRQFYSGERAYLWNFMVGVANSCLEILVNVKNDCS